MRDQARLQGAQSHFTTFSIAVVTLLSARLGPQFVLIKKKKKSNKINLGPAARQQSAPSPFLRRNCSQVQLCWNELTKLSLTFADWLAFPWLRFMWLKVEREHTPADGNLHKAPNSFSLLIWGRRHGAVKFTNSRINSLATTCFG